MEVENLVELVKMKNKTEVIVHKTTVSINKPFFNKGYGPWTGPYYIRVEGLFKEKGWKGFEPGHFVVTLNIDRDGIGEWSPHGYEVNTYSFFRLSPSNKPKERAEFLHYCLSDKKVFKQLEEDFGTDSSICIWVREKCPICYRDNKDD